MSVHDAIYHRAHHDAKFHRLVNYMETLLHQECSPFDIRIALALAEEKFESHIMRECWKGIQRAYAERSIQDQEHHPVQISIGDSWRTRNGDVIGPMEEYRSNLNGPVDGFSGISMQSKYAVQYKQGGRWFWEFYENHPRRPNMDLIELVSP